MTTSAEDGNAGGVPADTDAADAPDHTGSGAPRDSAAPERAGATDGDAATHRPSASVDAEMPESDDQVMDSLRSHVPITLLMDLSNPEGPHSAEISEQEGGDADWLDTGDAKHE